MNREPLAIIAAIVAVVQLLPPGAVIFDLVDWTVDQLAFIEAFVITLAVIPGVIFARTKVSPVNATPGE